MVNIKQNKIAPIRSFKSVLWRGKKFNEYKNKNRTILDML